MNWDDWRYFLALAHAGSLAAAARQLEVEHVTVARRVARLETALGLKLFDRLPAGWTLSAEGRACLAQAQGLETQIAGLRRSALSHPRLSGKVRVSVPPAILHAMVLPAVGAFRLSFPAIDLELIGERQLTKLEQGEADIALRLQDSSEPRLVRRSLGTVGYGLYGSPEICSLPPAERSYIGLDERLARLPQQRRLDELADGRRIQLRCSDIQTAALAAAQGLGLALLPHFLARAHAGLQALPIEPDPLSLRLYLVMQADVRRTPRVRHCADWLAELLGQQLGAMG